MNKIQQMHLDAITGAEYGPEDKQPNYVGFAEECSKVTEQIAVEFGKWLYTTESLDLVHDMKLFGEDTSIENLFQEFLKTKQ